MTRGGAVMDIVVWLRSLGLGKYEAAFRDNEIDETVLPSLTEEHLKQLGVTALGHRVKLLDAIAALRSGTSAPGPGHPKSPQGAPSPPLEDRAERRQVTVMFSDLVGSTALSTSMDPEDLREVISAYQKCVADTVQRFGGFVANYMGDGVEELAAVPERRHAKLLQVVRRQARKDRLVYLIVAECRLILSEAQAPQPDHNVHDGAPTRHCGRLPGLPARFTRHRQAILLPPGL